MRISSTCTTTNSGVRLWGGFKQLRIRKHHTRRSNYHDGSEYSAHGEVLVSLYYTSPTTSTSTNKTRDRESIFCQKLDSNSSKLLAEVVSPRSLLSSFSPPRPFACVGERTWRHCQHHLSGFNSFHIQHRLRPETVVNRVGLGIRCAGLECASVALSHSL